MSGPLQLVSGINPSGYTVHPVDASERSRARGLSACAPCVRSANHRSHTMSTPPTLTPKTRLTHSRCLHMCRTRVAQALGRAPDRKMGQRCRARCEPGSRLIRPRVPLGVRARVSPTPARRPTYPNSHAPRLDSRASPQVWCACSTTSRCAAEQPDGLRHRPEERAQALRPSSLRCGLAMGSRTTSPPSPHFGPCWSTPARRSGGGSSSRSGRPAADPSPPVRGPAACSRRRCAAAIWRRAVVAWWRDRLHCVSGGIVQMVVFAVLCIRACVPVYRRNRGAQLHIYKGLCAMGPLAQRRSRSATRALRKRRIS